MRDIRRQPSHPGALLADILPDTGMTLAELADATGVPLPQLESIMKEEAPITADVAEKIGAYFGDGPGIWLRMQVEHNVWGKLNAADHEAVDLGEYPTINEPHCENASYRCPCCKCLTLQERGGYEICPVCFWEDDGQDDPYADQISGGANGETSLTQGRANYAKYGAMEERFIKSVRKPTEDEAAPQISEE
jgi:addiction module HigA family antidote